MDFLARFWDTEGLGGAGPCLGGAAGGCVGFCCVNLGECMLVRVRRYEGSIKVIGVQLVVWEGDEEVVVAIGMRVVCRVERLELADLLDNDNHV